MKYIIIGLGNFGASLAASLVHLGHEVIGVDKKMEVTEKWKDHITTTITMDATTREAMESLPLKDVDAVVVGIGETPGISVMVTALLKQLGVERIICRVIDPLQKTILETMAISEFTSPEEDSANRMAYRLDIKGIKDAHKISENYKVLETEVPERYIGTAVKDIKFDQYKIKLITVIRFVEEKNIIGTIHSVKKVQGLDLAEIELQKSDTLLLFGEMPNLQDFIEL